MLLHPYDETPWNDQVLRESLALRTARAVNHLKATLDAGFTVLRDLGTEGAEYADVGLKEAVDQGIIPGPRLFVTTKAIVATGRKLLTVMFAMLRDQTPFDPARWVRPAA